MHKFYFLIILFFCFWGCVKPVELDLSSFDSKPVVNCLFTTDEPFLVHVSKTASQFDTLLMDIENAVVEVYKGEVIISELPFCGEGFYSDTTIYPEKGVLYTLKVSIPEYPVLIAFDSIPSNFSVFSYKGYEESAWYSEEGDEFGGLKFEINDVQGDNYYEVIACVSYSYSWEDDEEDTTIFRSSIGNLTCFDPVKEDDTWQSIFTDYLFDGRTYQIELMENNLNTYLRQDSLDYTIQVIQGTPTYYNYRMTYIRHQSAQYSDFFNPMEPVVMYSNIENGYGIFAGYQSRKYPINFNE